MMNMALDSPPGQGVLVPCRTSVPDVPTFLVEAEALWKAEQPDAQPGSVAASWGCVGVLFRDTPPSDWSSAWSHHFRTRVSPVAPVDDDGFLTIPWPEAADRAVDVDVILGLATKAESMRPRPEEVADAWIDQDQGHEHYFFENVRHGLRTSEDSLVWRRIEERRPAWIRRSDYAQAIAILRREEDGGV